MHYIRRDALFYFTLSAYPGLFHLAGFSLCVGPHLLLLSGSIRYAVFYTPALTSPNSTYFLGSYTLDFVDRPSPLPRKSALTWPPLPLRCPIQQGFSRTTHIQNRPTPSSSTTSNLQAPRPPAPLGLVSPLDIVWLLFWLHRQHDAVSVVWHNRQLVVH